jgi:hypothetical protein
MLWLHISRVKGEGFFHLTSHTHNTLFGVEEALPREKRSLGNPQDVAIRHKFPCLAFIRAPGTNSFLAFLCCVPFTVHIYASLSIRSFPLPFSIHFRLQLFQFRFRAHFLHVDVHFVHVSSWNQTTQNCYHFGWRCVNKLFWWLQKLPQSSWGKSWSHFRP